MLTLAAAADGARLATTRVPELKGNCRNPQPGTSGFIVFDRETRPLPSDGLGRLSR